MLAIARTLRAGLTVCLIAVALLACDSSSNNDTQAAAPVIPPPPVLPPPPEDIEASLLTGNDRVQVSITGVSFSSPPTVSFELVANQQKKVSGLKGSDLLATFAKLVADAADDSHHWVSLINSWEDPICRNPSELGDSHNQCAEFTEATDPVAIADTARKVEDPVATGKVPRQQAATESGGNLSRNADGSWSYTLLTDPGNPTALAETHRICLALSLEAPTNNACIDVVPRDLIDAAIFDKATSLYAGFYESYDSRQIAADETCNSCHTETAPWHRGATHMDYCVSCHNPGTIDANSENTTDFKVMLHRIHAGSNLPSVIGDPDADPPRLPAPYKIWGDNNNEKNYTSIMYPEPLNNCTRCHAGQEDVDYAAANNLPAPEATITPDGHLWATYPGREACESCHDDQREHYNDHGLGCVTCHNGGLLPDIQAAHRISTEESVPTGTAKKGGQ